MQKFAGLVRLDTTGYPVVITKGSVFVTAGTDRRSSGTHYTPKSLTEPIVQYTLEPLVYEGPAEGLPKHEWKLRSAKELLGLKICDMACGSGAFLVQACRYLAERLMEAWEDTEETAQVGHQDHLFEQKNRSTSVIRITPYGMSSEGGLYEQLVPIDADERQTYALRIVAQRCLYGVDKNPLAAEMAKLSLWLLTLAKDKPFEFLDHAIRCGDSLVGIHHLDQLKVFQGLPQNLWVKKLGLCPRPQDFQGMALVSNGAGKKPPGRSDPPGVDAPLAHRRAEYPLSGCVPAEPDSVSSASSRV